MYMYRLCAYSVGIYICIHTNTIHHVLYIYTIQTVTWHNYNNNYKLIVSILLF